MSGFERQFYSNTVNCVRFRSYHRLPTDVSSLDLSLQPASLGVDG